MYKFKYTYNYILKMDYLLFMDHIYYLDCIEAEENITFMQMIDNHLWLESKDEKNRNKYSNLYRLYESVLKKVKDIKIEKIIDPKVYNYFEKFRSKSSPIKKEVGDKN